MRVCIADWLSHVQEQQRKKHKTIYVLSEATGWTHDLDFYVSAIEIRYPAAP